MPGYLPQIQSNTPTKQDPGAFGEGQYKVQGYNIDSGAFQNPLGTAGTTAGFQTGQQQLLNAANTGAPVIGPAATSGGAGDQGQLAVANRLMGVATGAIPGAAATEAAKQGDIAQAQSLSALGSARGTSNPALAGYNAGNAAAGIRQNVAQNAVTGAAQERLGALNAAGQAFGGVTQNQQFNAQQIQQNAIQQATLEAQRQGLTGQELQDYVTNNANQIANSMTAAQAGQSLGVQNNLGTQQLQENAFNSAASHSIGGDIMNLAGSALNAAGSLAKFSDRRLKKNVKPAKEVLNKFLTTMRKVK